MADTGADITCMNHDLALRKGIKFAPSSASVKHAGNNYMDISGITRMRFTLDDAETVTIVYLVRNLGADTVSYTHLTLPTKA